MRLESAKVGPFKSINETQTVLIEDEVTVAVGMNEAGKTILLQAFEKSNDILGLAEFDPIEDYPRKDLSAYLKQHKTKAAEATVLTYKLTEREIKELNEALHTEVPADFRITVTHFYDNKKIVDVNVDERPVITALLAQSSLSSDAMDALKKCVSLRGIPEALKGISLTAEDKTFLAAVDARIAKTKWKSVVASEAWEWLENRLPKFAYFGEYELLPSKMNLADLAQRLEQAESKPKHLKADHRAVLALLRMADISVADLKSGGYEPLKAKIEAVSIKLTDQIMEFWKQNEDLEVEVDIKPDPEDESPYNSGPNLYLRIRNRRHRGVSTPFRQRSRGFIWFFSFLVWFDTVQHQLDAAGNTAQQAPILLLDEPGLNLHALAQADFLRYVDDLAKRHQVIYTTHSPFMVHSDRLSQIRVVEDRVQVGTVISDNVSGSDPRTVFPLQAALGWTIAQNLFISERNLLVEGPSDLIYLKAVSSMLETEGRTGLRADVTVVPTGGLDKVVTFVALLGANGLKLGVFHDYRGAAEQKLVELVRQKMISPKAVLNAAQFRDLSNIGVIAQASDIEDLFEPEMYLEFFNKAFAKQLNGAVVTEGDLPAGDRIIDRVERHLAANGIQLRQSGGFNHYTVASCFASSPPPSLGSDSLKRFEELFKAVNKLF